MQMQCDECPAKPFQYHRLIAEQSPGQHVRLNLCADCVGSVARDLAATSRSLLVTRSNDSAKSPWLGLLHAFRR